LQEFIVYVVTAITGNRMPLHALQFNDARKAVLEFRERRFELGEDFLGDQRMACFRSAREEKSGDSL